MVPRTVRAGNRTNVARCGEGFLDLYESELGAVPVLHVSGSPEEMGRQYGALVGAGIRRNLDRMLGLFTATGLPTAAVTLVLDKAWDSLRPYVPDRFLVEMEAVAEGARAAGYDVSFEDVARLTTVTNFDMYKREQRIAEMLAPHMSCTFFAVWGSRTTEGKLYASRNLDWVSQTGMHEDRLIAVYRPDGQNAFVTMGYAGVLGALAGMNERGICFSEIGAFSVREELDGTPWTFLSRRVLEEAKNLAEGVAIVEQAPHTLGYNYLVADGDPSHFGKGSFRPGAAAFETNFECCETLYDDDAKEHAACWIDPAGRRVFYGLPLKQAVMRADMAFAQKTRALQATDNGPGDPENTGDPFKGETYLNYHKPMHDMIRAYETGSEYTFPVRNLNVIEAGKPHRIGVEEALTIAATVAHNVEKLPENDWNVMSVVYAPTDLAFWVAFESVDHAANWKNAPDTGYWHFELSHLLEQRS